MPTRRRALTRDDVRRVIADHCLIGTSSPQIGVELEFLTFTPTGSRPSIDVLNAITAAPLPSGGRVTCEPGGQLEVSPPPQAGANRAIAVAAQDIVELHARATANDLELRAVGADRWRPPQRVVESTRYRVMEAHFDAAGPDGRRMMCNTAALQLNVDAPLGLERECWETAHAIGPALVAAFANSPDDDGCRSTRLTTWLAMDPTRTAPVAGDLPDAWFEYALAAPAILGRDHNGECVELPAGISFGQWLDSGCARGFATIDDLAYHLTLLFPPVRPRGWLEIRYLDALPSPWWEVAVQVAAALLSPDALGDARRAVAGTESLWQQAANHGLDDERLALAADACFAIAIAATGDAGVTEYMERYVSRRVPAWA